MQSFRKYLVEEGIDLLSFDGDPTEVFDGQSEDALSKILALLGINREDAEGPQFQEFENMNGNCCGNKFNLPENKAVRFNADNGNIENGIGSVNVWSGEGEDPLADISLGGVDAEDAAEVIIIPLNDPEQIDLEVDVIDDSNDLMNPIPKEDVQYVSDEGETYTLKQDKIEALEEGKFRIGNDVEKDVKSAIVNIFRRGYDKKYIKENLNIDTDFIDCTLKENGYIKTIDIRPGKHEIVTKIGK